MLREGRIGGIIGGNAEEDLSEVDFPQGKENACLLRSMRRKTYEKKGAEKKGKNRV